MRELPDRRLPDRLLAVRVLREECARAGFAGFGVARAQTPPGFERFREWVGTGRHAGMRYLSDTLAVRESPESLLPGARSIVCLSFPHRREACEAVDGSRFARYCDAGGRQPFAEAEGGSDYHGTLRARALDAAEASRRRLGGDWSYRVCVDSTPLAERAFAAAAGLGWIGKNGCLLDARHGSYVLLAEILTDLDLPADAPVAEQCGSCRRCLDACPTEAFLEPGILDAARCLAYWTIEHRGPIPDPWKTALGAQVFGCDLCQEVCPWNASLASLSPETLTTASTAPAAPAAPPPTRAQILAMGKGAWKRRFGKTALNRAARRGLQRNAAASAGACGDAACLPALETAERVTDRGLSDAARWARARLDRHPL